MHKFVIDNCKIKCFPEKKLLATSGESVVFDDAEYFGVADGKIILTANGKDYACSVSEVTAVTLDKRKGERKTDTLALYSGELPFIIAENTRDKKRFRLLEYIFDYITAYGFEVNGKEHTAVRLNEKYFVKNIDALNCTYYVDKYGELSDSNTGKRREAECRLTADGGLNLRLDGTETELSVETDKIESVIISKGRNFRYVTVSVSVKKRTGLFFSIHAYDGEKARALECAVVGILGEDFRLDRRENCLFHRKDKRRKK